MFHDRKFICCMLLRFFRFSATISTCNTAATQDRRRREEAGSRRQEAGSQRLQAKGTMLEARLSKEISSGNQKKHKKHNKYKLSIVKHRIFLIFFTCL